MDKIKVIGFHQPPLPFSVMTPIPKRHPQISPQIHQKMHKGCRNDYIEVFGEVYWAKKAVKNLRGVSTTPLRTMVKVQNGTKQHVNTINVCLIHLY